MNKVDQVDDKELLDLVELEVRNFCLRMIFRGRHSDREGSALAALEGRDDAIGKGKRL